MCVYVCVCVCVCVCVWNTESIFTKIDTNLHDSSVNQEILHSFKEPEG